VGLPCKEQEIGREWSALEMHASALPLVIILVGSFLQSISVAVQGAGNWA
jgi:hypothetical protein